MQSVAGGDPGNSPRTSRQIEQGKLAPGSERFCVSRVEYEERLLSSGVRWWTGAPESSVLSSVTFSRIQTTISRRLAVLPTTIRRVKVSRAMGVFSPRGARCKESAPCCEAL